MAEPAKKLGKTDSSGSTPNSKIRLVGGKKTVKINEKIKADPAEAELLLRPTPPVPEVEAEEQIISRRSSPKPRDNVGHIEPALKDDIANGPDRSNIGLDSKPGRENSPEQNARDDIRGQGARDDLLNPKENDEIASTSDNDNLEEPGGEPSQQQNQDRDSLDTDQVADNEEQTPRDRDDLDQEETARNDSNVPNPSRPLGEQEEKVYDTGPTEPSDTTGKPKAADSSNKSSSPEDLAEAEKTGGQQPSTTDDNPEEESEALVDGDNTPKHRYFSGKPLGVLSRFKHMKRRKKIGIGVGVLGVVVGLIVGLLSILPFELIGIKNVALTKIGGVEGHTYSLARNKIYSTQFFFDENKTFSGFKVGGVRRLMLENRSTKKITQALAANGYQINFADGKIKSLVKVDAHGRAIPGETYTSNSQVRAAWDIKKSGDLNNILKQVFPDKSDFWYNRATKQMYRRWGLTLENWAKDKIYQATGVNKAKEVELQFKKALRQKLFGTYGGYTAQIIDPSVKDPATATPDQKNTIERNGVMRGVLGAAKDLRNKLLADPTYNGEASILDSVTNADFAAGTASSALKKSLSVETLNVLNAGQNVCLATSSLNAVVTGARVLRAAQLMTFAGAILNQADVLQNGTANTAAQTNGLMNYINSKDGNGKTFFDSSGWRYWAGAGGVGASKGLFGSFDKNQRDQYSVGGGFTGSLGTVNSVINKNGGGPSCSVINNPFVSFFGLVVGIGAGIITGGGFSVIDASINVGVTFATQFAVSVATQLLTPMVAGTIINGAEKGTGVGNAFVSGFETLASANGASTGMRPLKKAELVAIQSKIAQENKIAASRQPLAYRLFSPNADNSLTNSVAMSLASFKPASFLSSLVPKLSSFGNLFGQKASAASSSDICPDGDITSHDLAATPFCNIIVGIPDSTFDRPDLAPDVIDDTMNDPGNIIGNPLGPDGVHINNVDDYGNAVPGSKYADYLQQCTSDSDVGTGGIDIIHKVDSKGNTSGNYTADCTNDLFNVYKLYMTVAQGENDALTGNINTAPAVAPNSATPSPAAQAANPVPATGTAQDVAKAILANPKIAYRGTDVQQDIQAAANGTAGSAGAMTSLAVLQLIQAIGQDHSVAVTAIQSGGAGHCNNTPKSACPTDRHYTGDAVDFGSLDGRPLSGRDGNSIIIANIAMKLLPAGTGFGQSTCSGTALTLAAGFSEFADSCDHLHIQVPAGTP